MLDRRPARRPVKTVFILLLWVHFDGGSPPSIYTTRAACEAALAQILLRDPNVPGGCYEIKPPEDDPAT